MKEVITMNLSVGNDNGNSEHDIIINGEIIRQPNVFAKPIAGKLPNLDGIKTETIIEDIHNRLIVTIDSPSSKPGIYYIGEYAKKSREKIKAIDVGVDNSKVNSDIVINNTLGQIAAYGVKKAFKKNPELDKQINLYVDMATSLPVTQFSKENAEKFEKRFMINNHKITVHVGDKRVDVVINFKFVKVLPESVPVVFALQNINNSNKGNESYENLKKEMLEKIFTELKTTYNREFTSNDFIDKRMLHISIGEGTTEYPITNDIGFDPQFIEGSNNGIGHAIKKATPLLAEETGNRSISRADYSYYLRNKEHKWHEESCEFIEQPLEDESEDILTYAKSELEKANNDVDYIIIHGGGSILMRSYLYDKLFALSKTIKSTLFYVPEEYAVTLEVIGLYEFVIGDIFQAIKEVKENVKKTS